MGQACIQSVPKLLFFYFIPCPTSFTKIHTPSKISLVGAEKVIAALNTGWSQDAVTKTENSFQNMKDSPGASIKRPVPNGNYQRLDPPTVNKVKNVHRLLIVYCALKL